MSGNSNKITISYEHMFSFNEYSNFSRKNKFLAAQKMKKAIRETIELLEIEGQKYDFFIDEPVKLTYTWTVLDLNRDGDGISSTGRKIIQDAMEKTPVNESHMMVKNDNLMNIVGSEDIFVLGKEEIVTIEMTPRNPLRS